MSLKLLASAALALHPVPHHYDVAGCKKTYTVSMAVRAIDTTYRSGLPARRTQTDNLKRYIHCQRNPAAQPYLIRVWRAKSTLAPLQGPAIASWYNDGGTTGCGFHTTYGVATLIAPCGSRMQICNGSSCIVATRDDSGPYAAGRTFDLNPTAKAALNCTDLCTVTYRML